MTLCTGKLKSSDGNAELDTNLALPAGQPAIPAAVQGRVRDPDGTRHPWTSPSGKPMRSAAGAPDIPWTDLVYSLQPNGRTLDYTITPDDPAGVTKPQSSDLNPVG